MTYWTQPVSRRLRSLSRGASGEPVPRSHQMLPAPIAPGSVDDQIARTGESSGAGMGGEVSVSGGR